MDVDFIDDEWVQNANNRQERGAYKPTKEEWRYWYINMPNQRKGNLFDLAAYIKKHGLSNFRPALFSR